MHINIQYQQCKVLKIPRSTYYDSIKRKDNKITKDDSNVERAVINILILIEKSLVQDELKII